MKTLPTIATQLAAHNIKADKRLGQHFLLDQNITDKIARFAGDLLQVNVMEIGPGPGGLTRSLAKSLPKSLHLVEMDQRFLPLLAEVQNASEGDVKIHHADGLNFNLLAELNAPRAIIANLPYNVGTQMLVNWLQIIANDAANIDQMILMFQAEVVKRIAAPASSKSFGRLSVLAQWLCEVDVLYDLPPSAFSPPPKVDSAVVRLKPRARPLKCSIEMLEKVTAAAFGQRRKMLRSSLKSLHADAESLCESIGIKPTLRAENLSIEQFVLLSNALSSQK